jgi:hypothetical protein
MKTLLYRAMSPVVAIFLATRFLVRGITFIVTPILAVLALFAFGISWLLFQCWRLTKPPTNALTLSKAEETSAYEWKDWRRCMIEAGFDTSTAFI